MGSSTDSYTTTFTVDKTPQQVFDAIVDVRGWWIGKIEGTSDNLDAEFSYTYENLHYSKQKVTEFVPGQKLVWAVTEADIVFGEDRAEWVGTDIVFDISVKDGRTEVRFTHVGLTPEFECYDSCSSGWDYYAKGGLPSYIKNL
jgi:hypothetical protein